MPPKAPPRRPAPPHRPNPADSSNPTQPAPDSTTPAPSSSRPPVQRLRSLKKTNPSGSITPSPKPPSGPGGEQPKPALKYRPKAVGRRSREEREAIEKVEAERHRERVAEAAAKQRGRGAQGRGRGGRDRGGPGFGRGGRGDGPRRGRGGALGRVGSESASRSRTRSVIDVPSAAASRDVSSDESDNDVRVSMDLINLQSEDDEEEDGFDGKVSAKKGKMPARVNTRGGLRPVRVEAHEHQDRVVSVNMESSSSKPAPAVAEPEGQAQTQAQTPKTKDSALFVEDATTPSNGKEPRIKEEPVDDEDQVMADVPHAEDADDGPLPETPKVRKRFVNKEQPDEEPAVEPPVQEPSSTDPRNLLRTAEEKQEHERHEHDLEEIRKLFAVDEKETAQEPPPQPQPEPSTETGEEPAEQEKAPEDEPSKDKLAGHLFLMQFPPMTPNLLASSVENDTTTHPQVKPDPEPEPAEGNPPTNETDADVQLLNSNTTPAAAQILTASDWQLQAGRAGKLNVHASGRVTMDWGGIRFELDLATGVDFLQEAVVKSAPEQAGETGQAAAEEDENKVWSMGQLSGKFTVMPDWEAML